MKLETLEKEWSAYLASENCPPVLDRYQRPPWRLLFNLLEIYPASISVWLARVAGEAYEAGAFWEKFGALTGITVPMNQRERLPPQVRAACRRKMGTWIPPTDVGGRNYVAEFLHQAGLPLDRCASFALHVRKVERSL